MIVHMGSTLWHLDSVIWTVQALRWSKPTQESSRRVRNHRQLDHTLNLSSGMRNLPWSSRRNQIEVGRDRHSRDFHSVMVQILSHYSHPILNWLELELQHSRVVISVILMLYQRQCSRRVSRLVDLIKWLLSVRKRKKLYKPHSTHNLLRSLMIHRKWN